MTEFLGIIHMVRNDGYSWQLGKNGQTKYKELQLVIKIINRFVPLITRVYTRKKIFAGFLTELKSKNGTVKFTITDCHIDGTSSESARTYVKEVALDDLTEIMPIKLSTDNLWALYLKEKEKKQ